MHRHEVPIDNEKNAWPRASSMTSLSTLLKSGLNRKLMPSDAPGSMHDATAMMMSSTKSVGMRRFDTFSMPLRTPLTTTAWVRRMNPKVQSTGLTGSVLNSWK